MASILRQLEPETYRKIGHEHMVVVPAVTEQLVSVRDHRARLVQMDEVIASVKGRLAKLELDRARLAVFLTEFEAAKLDRRETDPDVPLEEPKPDPKGTTGHVRPEPAGIDPKPAQPESVPVDPGGEPEPPRSRG